MSAFTEPSINNNTWTEVVASSNSKCYLQARNDENEGVIWRFGASLPSALLNTGHNLLPGHPVLLELPASENVYAKCLNAPSGTVKVTAI